LKQILALILFVFVFFGCTQKQVVELKLPNKNKIEKQVQKEKKVEEDSVTVVEEFTPIDIKESDIKEETIPNGSMNTIDEENINIQIDETKAKIKIAFIYPSSLVSKYAKNSMNTISGYLSYKKADYNLVVIDCENESYDKISSAFSKIEEEGITKVIALFTPNAINTLNKVVSNDLRVYLPLIVKKRFFRK